AILPPEQFPPAPGQGALAVQIRTGDDELATLIARIDHPPTRLAVMTERAVLERTGGGCRAPIGVHATVPDGQIRVLAGAVEPDGRNAGFVERTAPIPEAASLAHSVGDDLLVGAAA